MKKAVFVLLLVVLLLSLTLPVALAGCPAGDDPTNPGGHSLLFAPPGLADKIGVSSAPGKAGDNWTKP